MHSVNVDALWELAFENRWQCPGCRYFIVTHDKFGTGDSPPEENCTVLNVKDCPVVEQALRRMTTHG